MTIFCLYCYVEIKKKAWARSKGVEVIHVRAVYSKRGSPWIDWYNELAGGFRKIETVANVSEDWAEELPGEKKKIYRKCCNFAYILPLFTAVLPLTTHNQGVTFLKK